MNQTWLGIDPGLATIGWAFLVEVEETEAQLLEFGTIETSKELATSERLLTIERDMVELIAEFRPAHIAIEMPFFGRSIKAAGGVLQAFGVINLVCYREMGIQPVYLHQSSWKCHLGYGRADTDISRCAHRWRTRVLKNEVAGMVQVLFDLETLPVDDSVDAIGIGYAGLCGLRNNIN